MRHAVVLALGALAAGGAGMFFLANRDPGATAKVKCEFAIEDLTALRVDVRDVARATVIGDENNGTVAMPFTSGSTRHVAECIFERGRFRRVSLDGQIIAGR